MNDKTETSIYETKEIGVAAYLKMKGKEMVSHSKSDDGRVINFEFNDEKKDCDMLRVEYFNSPFKIFDGWVRDLKKFLRK